MSKRDVLQLLEDLRAAGVVRDTDIKIPPQPYTREGIVAETDETVKMEIAGLPCGVKQETTTEARVYVFTQRGVNGPYHLRPCEVL